ncbi:hypothetical protein K438DRAFT_1786997 [Mycena galopus ATCC 62051]|nr:hypothetical protein K438DRAFT_1786997 [Mycena galopus ATCC 62051]
MNYVGGRPRLQNIQGAMWSGISDVPLGCYHSCADEMKGAGQLAWREKRKSSALPAFSAAQVATPSPGSVLRRQHEKERAYSGMGKRGAGVRDQGEKYKQRSTPDVLSNLQRGRADEEPSSFRISKQRRQPARRFVRCLETEACVRDMECGTRCDFCGVGGRETDQVQQVEDDVTTRGEESEVREARRVLPSAAQVFLCSETALHLSARGLFCASGRSLAVIGVSHSLAITLDVVVDEEHCSVIFDANIAKCAFLRCCRLAVWDNWIAQCCLQPTRMDVQLDGNGQI